MDDALPILIRAWRDRADQTAARRIVDALYPLVARIVRRHATGCDSPEDLAQEVFTRLFETLDRYDDPAVGEYRNQRIGDEKNTLTHAPSASAAVAASGTRRSPKRRVAPGPSAVSTRPAPAAPATPARPMD
jgi:hypothetical protein